MTPYERAVKADDAYTAAIKTQFGERVTRWDVHVRTYNDATKAAYTEKMEADKALHAAFEKART